MLTFMDYIQQSFSNSTGWGTDGSYEHILRSSHYLLDFSPPQGIKLAVNNRNTTYGYSSLEINQMNRLNGSLSYLYSSIDLSPFYMPSKSIKLQEMIQGYKDILKPLNFPSNNGSNHISGTSKSQLLLYGKLYFPSQLLEGMIIKRFSNTDQLIIKFINTQKINRMSQPNSIFTFYWQRKLHNSFYDLIYSTHESLFGYRSIYNFDYFSPTAITNKFQVPSKLSIGCELWYAAATMSPGASLAARYTTYMLSPNHQFKSKSKSHHNSLSAIKKAKANAKDEPALSQHPHHNIHVNHLLTNEELALQQQQEQQLRNKTYLDSGLNDIDPETYALNPFTFTFALNPLLGTLESTYAISSSNHGLTLSSRYLFNVYSYDSDLVLGIHFLRTRATWNSNSNNNSKIKINSDDEQIIIKQQQPTSEYLKDKIREHPFVQAVSDYSIVKSIQKGYMKPELSEIETSSDDLQTIEKPIILTVRDSDEDFISSLKISGSIHKKTSTLAWEGKFKDWLVSSGVIVDFNEQVPRFKGYGLELQYTS